MLTQAKYALPRSTPEQQGVSSAAILEFVHALESRVNEPHSFMLLRHGCVIAEGWWSPYERQYRHMMFSVSKSFAATAVGLAANEGCLSLEDKVLSFFPDEATLAANEHLAEMRVRHVLSMATGHTMDTWANMAERSDGNWIKAFFETPIAHAPGTYFLYHTGASYMLSAIVQKATGVNLLDFLNVRLFEPLEIANATWDESPQGIKLGGIGLNIRTEDLARFGQLYLQRGTWQGRQLLPEAWVTEATARHMPNGNDPDSDWAQGYGYQFWRGRHESYRADGVFGQSCLIMPQQDAVLAMTGGVDLFEMQGQLNVFWETLFPALVQAPLPEDAESHQRLSNKLSSLRLLPTQGKAHSPLAAQISTRTYRFETNALKIETITFNFSESECIFSVTTAEGSESVRCGFQQWTRGHTALFDNMWITGAKAVAASGAWATDDSYSVIFRLYETPFYHSLMCHFLGDELILEAKVNVSFEGVSPLILTARAG